MTAALELPELRRRVASELTTAGSGPQVKAGVQSMAELPLPLNQKYLSIDAAAIVRGNTVGDGRAQVMERMGRLVKALNVLEKYGLNLHNLARPRYWRSVKHNNPIFKAQVDSMQGGRGILYLYGYTVQQVDGLVFPDDVLQPDRDKVAAVTLEVTCLRLELEMLIKGNHPNPEFFKDVLPLVVPEVQQQRNEAASLPPVRRDRTPSKDKIKKVKKAVRITFPWAEKQVQNLKTMMASFSFLQSLTSQSPTGEITINLVPVEEVF
ncbi:unnamed protein product [Arctogadus glacialis]